MNKKHIALVFVAGLIGAAQAVAAAEPALAVPVHVALPMLAAVAAWLGMTSPAVAASGK